ncbi:MAG: nitroreductase family protein [Ruminiclostridium sp.]|nr:nitroreductase family protein [Ruminiclostridium sp.]
MNDFFNIIDSRTSYRGTYKNEKIPKDDLIKIMNAGLAAPSGCNKQPRLLPLMIRFYWASCWI